MDTESGRRHRRSRVVGGGHPTSWPVTAWFRWAPPAAWWEENRWGTPWRRSRATLPPVSQRARRFYVFSADVQQLTSNTWRPWDCVVIPHRDFFCEVKSEGGPYDAGLG